MQDKIKNSSAFFEILIGLVITTSLIILLAFIIQQIYNYAFDIQNIMTAILSASIGVFIGVSISKVLKQ